MENEILDGMSMDIEKTNMDKLKSVFPECFAEGKLDIDKLLSLCGEYITNDFEKYKFEWSGKSECLQLAQRRSTGTLRPCIEESVNFDETQNVYIEGDNLEVLKLLQKAYYRKVKMIYIDPPYNTGNDFVYEDDFADPITKYKEVTQQTTKSNPETMGRFHTNWLNMMYPRLRLAANLLRDDGVIFISIDDNEVTNLRKLCDEVFGEENFFAILTRRCMHTVRNSSKDFNKNSDYIIVYAKNKTFYSEDKSRYIRAKVDKTDNYKLNDNDGKGFYKLDPIYARNYAKPYKFIFGNGVVWEAPQGSYPRYSQETLQYKYDNNELDFSGKEPRAKRYLNEVQVGQPPDTFMKEDDVGFNSEGTKELADILNHDKVFSQPKPVKLIKYLINLLPYDENDIILDFFSGSSTTAQAVIELNKGNNTKRRFICIQLPQNCDTDTEAYKAGYTNICEIGKERIRRVGKKISQQNSQIIIDEEKHALDVGFKVFKLDTSNFLAWDGTNISVSRIEELAERLNSMTDRSKYDRTDLDIVYEIMLKLGIPLTETVQKVEVGGKTAYSICDNCLILVCLEDNISTETVQEMAETYAPAQIVFGQDSFKDVTAMSNAKLVLRDRGIEIKFV